MKKFLVFFLVLTFLTSALFSVVASGASGVATKPNQNKTTIISGVIAKVNPGMPYNKEMLALKTQNSTFILTGKITGIEKYIGYNSTMSGNAQIGPQGIQFFNVNTFKIIGKQPTSTIKPLTTITPTLSTTPKTEPIDAATPVITGKTDYVILRGYLSDIDPKNHRFLLKTENIVYELMGNTAGMENFTSKELEVAGGYVYTFAPTEYPLFSVVWYKEINMVTPSVSPISTPTAPAVKTITEADDGGYIYIKNGDEVKLILDSNPSTGYKWSFDQKPDETILLQTNYEYVLKENPNNMVGVGGSEIWTFKGIGIGTTVMYMSYSRPWESVAPARSFKVKVIVEPQTLPTPVYTVEKGYLSVTKVEPLPNEELASPYVFTLKTESGPLTLQGNVKGLENYDGQEIEVTGTMSLFKIYPPIFNVITYKVLVPTPTVTVNPTPMISKTHTIISDKPMYLSDPSIGSMEVVNGYTTISWTDNAQKAFFDAKITVTDKNIDSVYEFELVNVKTCDNSSIIGTFNINKDGKIVGENISGQLYGLESPVGSYFKFYSYDEKWHMSAYVISRIDF